MAVIGVDFGNCNSFPCYIEGMDEKTRRGGTEIDLVPREDRYRCGIPTTFFYSGKDSTEYFGMEAKLKKPLSNQRNLLKRKIDTTEIIDGKHVSYNDVISKMIQHIVRMANRRMAEEYGTTTNEISLAYPVTISQDKWRKLKELAERGTTENGKPIRVVGSIEEPAGAALAYLASLERNVSNDQTVMVYDLGGGTFDIANVYAHPQGLSRNGAVEYYDTLEVDGIEKGVGGYEFDKAMAELIQSKKPNARWTPGQLESVAEEAKIALSNQEEYDIDVITAIGFDTLTVTRKEYEAKVLPLVNQTVDLLRQTVSRAKRKPDLILLTGGQSQMPLIQRRIEEVLPEYRGRIKRYKSSTAIAVGAARYGALVDRKSEHAVKKRNTYPIGVDQIRIINSSDPRLRESHVDILIPAGSVLPTSENEWRNYSLATSRSEDYSNIVEARKQNPDVFRDEDFISRLRLKLSFDREMPKGTGIDVCVWLDMNNLLHAKARDHADPAHCIQASIEITNISND